MTHSPGIILHFTGLLYYKLHLSFRQKTRDFFHKILWWWRGEYTTLSPCIECRETRFPKLPNGEKASGLWVAVAPWASGGVEPTPMFCNFVTPRVNRESKRRNVRQKQGSTRLSDVWPLSGLDHRFGGFPSLWCGWRSCVQLPRNCGHCPLLRTTISHI